MDFWHIQMNQPWGRGEIKIDSKSMLENTPPIIGTGEWNNIQCKHFKGEKGGIKLNDIVLVREGQTPIAICEIISNSFQDDNLTNIYHHVLFRKVKVLDFFKDNTTVESILTTNLESFNATHIQAVKTLTKCVGYNATNNFIKEWYQLYLKNSEMNNYIKLLQESKNLIFTGAPGTGKSYLAKEIARQMIGLQSQEELKDSEQYDFVQFHPSYDYTDFVEGLRPAKPDENGNIGFELKDGVFKSFCKKALKVSSDNFDESWESLIEKIQDNDDRGFLTKIGRREYSLSSVNSLKYTSNSPSEYKHTITKQNVYDAYQNKKARPSGASQKFMEEVVEFMKGHFGLNEYVEDDKNSDGKKKYIFLIDEINRGEISKIFGELFFSIDPSYRGRKGEVKTQYSNLHDDENEMFYIPENVYIIGTMNDIDRSVESFDFAMRRRFVWQEITAKESAENMNLSDEVKFKMNALNKAIENIEGLNSSYHIGGAYFLDKDGNPRTDFEKLWTQRIEPLLKEYLRGMPNSEEDLKKLKSAFNTGNQSENNGQ